MSTSTQYSHTGLTVHLHSVLTHRAYCPPPLSTHTPGLLSTSTRYSHTGLTVHLHSVLTHRAYCPPPLGTHTPGLLSTSTRYSHTGLTVHLHSVLTHRAYCPPPLGTHTRCCSMLRLAEYRGSVNWVVRLLWSTKYTRPLCVCRVSQPGGSGPRSSAHMFVKPLQVGTVIVNQIKRL